MQNYYISIHLMLLFIFSLCCFINSIKIFQYISCYCLSRRIRIHRGINKISIHLMLLFILVFPFFATFFLRFQYISCYCLSMPLSFSSSSMPRFQYISCYCLSSFTAIKLCSYAISIHLMLLFIVVFLLLQSFYLNFNTSHVTVYHILQLWTYTYFYISIHLMLLFIMILLFFECKTVHISIHLMLLFIKIIWQHWFWFN